MKSNEKESLFLVHSCIHQFYGILDRCPETIIDKITASYWNLAPLTKQELKTQTYNKNCLIN